MLWVRLHLIKVHMINISWNINDHFDWSKLPFDQYCMISVIPYKGRFFLGVWLIGFRFFAYGACNLRVQRSGKQTTVDPVAKRALEAEKENYENVLNSDTMRLEYKLGAYIDENLVHAVSP